MMQEMWTAGLEWDKLCPKELIHKSQKCFFQLEELPTIKVPRCLRFWPEEVGHRKMQKYGSLVYLRVVYGSESVSSRLVAAKTRSAPLAATSIPRLEVISAILGLKLTESVSGVFSPALGHAVFLFDSFNVPWWIKGRRPRFKPFVGKKFKAWQIPSSGVSCQPMRILLTYY